MKIYPYFWSDLYFIFSMLCLILACILSCKQTNQKRYLIIALIISFILVIWLNQDVTLKIYLPHENM